MKKIKLLLALSEYQKNRPLFSREDIRITSLKNFLQTPATFQAAEKTEIKFADFANFLKTKKIDPEKMFSKEFFASDNISKAVFSAFKFEGTSKPIPRSEMQTSLLTLPAGLNAFLFGKHLTEQDIENVALTCSVMHKEMLSNEIWKQKILASGRMTTAEVTELQGTHLPINYKKLYRSLLLHKPQKFILWEYLCLSGCDEAIDYLLNNNLITESTRDAGNATPLLLFAIMGSLAGLKKLWDRGFTATHVNQARRGLLDFAVLGGNNLVLEYYLPCFKDMLDKNPKWGEKLVRLAISGGNISTFNILQELKLNCGPCSKKERNPVQIAGSTGQVKMMFFAAKHFGIRPKANLHNPIFLAAANKNLPVIRAAIKMGYSIMDVHPWWEEYNMLQVAALAGDTQMMRLAAEEFKIKADSTVNRGTSLLQLAGQSGNIEAMKLAISWKNDPYKKDEIGGTLMHDVAGSSNIEAFEWVRAHYDFDIHALNQKGWNVMTFATMGQRENLPQMIQHLRSLGVQPVTSHRGFTT